MGLATFKGGVHPYEGKELAENKPVQVLEPKGDLVFPMSQPIGPPANPLVSVGDHNQAGQKIPEAVQGGNPFHRQGSGNRGTGRSRFPHTCKTDS